MKIFRVIATVYSIGFALVLWVELASGPVTPALAFSRAVAWPIYITTGIPKGYRDSGDGPPGDYRDAG